MRKYFTISLVWLFFVATMQAQSPEGMKYQATIRGSDGSPVQNKDVGMRISILKSSPTGSVVYSETYSPVPHTNSFGLVTLNIGEGVPGTGSFATISWGSDTYYLKVEADPQGGTAYLDLGTSQLMSVPYSFYATKAGNGFSGSYTDLTNKPGLFDGTWGSLTGKPAFAIVATTGNYSDLLNAPTLFDGSWSSLSGKPLFSTVATSGSYTDLSNKPSLFDGTWTSLTGKPVFATVATSGSYNDLSNKPTFFDGTWSSLTGKPTLAQVATTGDYNDLINQPTGLNTDWADITNKPLTFPPSPHSHSSLDAPGSPGSNSLAVDVYSNIGIGTLTPLRKVQIDGPDASLMVSRLSADPNLELRYYGTPLPSINTLMARVFATENGDAPAMGGMGFFLADKTNHLYKLGFFTNTNAGSFLQSKMVIDEQGQVGIGTTAPSEKLEVNGTVKANGIYMPTGADQNLILTSDAIGNASWQLPVGTVPVGGIVAWLKSFPNVPSLPDNFVECNGQVLDDPSSPFTGNTIPDLNGVMGSRRFLMGGYNGANGDTESGTTGGAATHSHTGSTNYTSDVVSVNATAPANTPVATDIHAHTLTVNAASNLPPYYTVVWIMRIK